MAKLTKKQAAELVPVLEALYPEAKCALDFDTRFHLLCAVLLSAQTTDVSVNKVTPVLFAKYPEARDIADAPLPDLETILRPVGMYKTKAKHLKAMAKTVAEEYNGDIPHDYAKLTALPGVGRKTANVVLAEGFGEQRIAVDTHVFRLANRIGLTEETDVLRTEEGLMKILPYDHWTSMHHSLIFHGRRVCSARKPNCEICGIRRFCKRNGLPNERKGEPQ